MQGRLIALPIALDLGTARRGAAFAGHGLHVVHALAGRGPHAVRVLGEGGAMGQGLQEQRWVTHSILASCQ